jgi:hypothetical protein
VGCFLSQRRLLKPHMQSLQATPRIVYPKSWTTQIMGQSFSNWSKKSTSDTQNEAIVFHRRMAWGDHGLPKVSPRPALPNPSMPSRWATTDTALRPFLGWPAHKAGGLQLSSSLLDTPRCTVRLFVFYLFVRWMP